MLERVMTGEPFIPSFVVFCGPFAVLTVLAIINHHHLNRAFKKARAAMAELRREWQTRLDAQPLAPTSGLPAVKRMAVIPQPAHASQPPDSSRRLDQSVQALTPPSGAR